jgi:hypothetical protein
VHYHALLPDSPVIIPTSYLASHVKVLHPLNGEIKNLKTATTGGSILAVSGIAKYNWAERPNGGERLTGLGYI